MSAWCDRDLIRSPLYYAVVFTEKDFHRELRGLGLPRDKWPAFLASDHAGATAHYFESGAKKRCAIVCMHPQPDRDQVEVVGLLVHEAMHLWRWIREDIGEREPSSEFEAYSMQWITQQLCAAYRDFMSKQVAA